MCLTTQGYGLCWNSKRSPLWVRWCACSHQRTISGHTLACSRHLMAQASWTVRPCREKRTKGAKVAHLIKSFLKTKNPTSIHYTISEQPYNYWHRTMTNSNTLFASLFLFHVWGPQTVTSRVKWNLISISLSCSALKFLSSYDPHRTTSKRGPKNMLK